MNAFFARGLAAFAAAAMAAACAAPDAALHPEAVRSVWLTTPTPASAATTTVYFATDRARDAAGDFTGGWTPGLSCGEAVVTLPSGRPPATAWGPWRIEAAWPELNQAVLASPIEVQDCNGRANREAAVKKIEDAAAAAHCDSVLVFVHGFNNTFPGALFKTAQVAHDVQFACLAVTFSWASDGFVKRYMEDSEEADLAEPQLLEYLRALGASPRIKRIDVIAHSIGPRVVLATIGELGRVAPLPRHPLINQLVLAAPDVEDAVFVSLVERARPLVGRITVYASKGDVALAASREEHGGVARAGSVPEELKDVPGVETIDVSDAPTDFWGHSYFAQSTDVVTDIAATLRDAPLTARVSDQPPGLACSAGSSLCNMRIPRGEGPSWLSHLVRWFYH